MIMRIFQVTWERNLMHLKKPRQMESEGRTEAEAEIHAGNGTITLANQIEKQSTDTNYKKHNFKN